MWPVVIMMFFTIDCSTVYDRRNVRIDKRLSIDDQKSRTVSTTTIEHTRFDVCRVCGWLGGLVMCVCGCVSLCAPQFPNLCILFGLAQCTRGIYVCNTKIGTPSGM